MRQRTEWLTGLVRTMDAVARGGACRPIDATLRDRFLAHFSQQQPAARIPLVPEPGETQPAVREHLKTQ